MQFSNRSSKVIPLYWRFQLTGWSLYFIICYLFLISNVRVGSADYHSALSLIGKQITIGLFISHVMRWVIIKLNVLAKQLIYQAVLMVLMTVFFSIVYIYLFRIAATYSFSIEFSRRSLNVFWFQFIFISGSLLIWNLIYFVYHYMNRSKTENARRMLQEKELMELEARALLARMNPHFIFNSLNSIKSLIQKGDQENSIVYLTTLSKLIRLLFYNSEKRITSLYDEVEHCRLYLELEAMRLGGELRYAISVDEKMDLRSVTIPAFLIQPFVENAIWHGIVPRGHGFVKIGLQQEDGRVICTIEDDGIGREMAQKNKPVLAGMYESKGIDLTVKRLQLESMLKESEGDIKIVDKMENGVASGTLVIISFNFD